MRLTVSTTLSGCSILIYAVNFAVAFALSGFGIYSIATGNYEVWFLIPLGVVGVFIIYFNLRQLRQRLVNGHEDESEEEEDCAPCWPFKLGHYRIELKLDSDAQLC